MSRGLCDVVSLEARASRTNWMFSGCPALSLYKYVSMPNTCADDTATRPLARSVSDIFAARRVAWNIFLPRRSSIRTPSMIMRLRNPTSTLEILTLVCSFAAITPAISLPMNVWTAGMLVSVITAIYMATNVHIMMFMIVFSLFICKGRLAKPMLSVVRCCKFNKNPRCSVTINGLFRFVLRFFV